MFVFVFYLYRMVSKCTLKAAHLAAVLGQYDNAIEKFESVAAASVDNQLTKWSVKEYFLKAGLCQLCTGVRFLDYQCWFVCLRDVV
jgi:Soluble NSF attachment protein, SNAP